MFGSFVLIGVRVKTKGIREGFYSDPNYSMSISPKAPTVGEHPLQALCPRHRCAAFDRRSLLWRIGHFGLVALTPLRRCHLRTVLAVGANTPWKRVTWTLGFSANAANLARKSRDRLTNPA